MKPTSLMMAAGVAIGLAAAQAFAHDDAYLATQNAPNGGQLRMAGPYHYELVTDRQASGSNESVVVVYVTDHAGAPVSTKGATGVATVLFGKERSAVRLAPDGDNRMKGVGRYASTPEVKVIVAITWPGAGTEQARFASSPSVDRKAPMKGRPEH